MATGQPPLLHRSPLYPDESLSSYLSRLASLNRYVPFSILTNLIHRRLTRLGLRDGLSSLQHPETFEVLEGLTQTRSIVLANASVHHLAQAPILAHRQPTVIWFPNGHLLPLFDQTLKVRKLRRNGQAQFCPDCLAEVAYHHLSWIPGEVTTCLSHRCLLRDRCPHCQGSLSISDIATQHCPHCGSDLVHAVNTYIPDNSLELFAQQTIQTWWGVTKTPTSQSNWALPSESPVVMYHLFEQLTEIVKLKWDWEHFYRQTSLPPKTHAIQTAAFKALIHWPQGFWDFLQEYLYRERALHAYNNFLHSAHESLLATQLWELATLPDFDFVQVALTQFLAKNNFQINFNRSSPCIYWPGTWHH